MVKEEKQRKQKEKTELDTFANRVGTDYSH